MPTEHDGFRKNVIREIEQLRLKNEPAPLFEMLENLYRAAYRIIGALEFATGALEELGHRIDDLEDISQEISKSADKIRKRSYTAPKRRTKKACHSKSKKPTSTA